MRAIQHQLPNPRHVELHRIYVKAKPEVAWPVARHFDASTIPWVRMLFDIRSVPDLIRGRVPDEADRRIGVDQVADSGEGFMIVHETPGKEVVVGAVGQFWHLNIPLAQVKPEDFREFTEPGWGKLAWAIAVEPFLDGSTISFEVRTTANDEESWRQFNNYYHVIGTGSQLIRHSVMAQLQAELGKLPLPNNEERRLPGDDLIPGAKYTINFDNIIEAPVSLVWRYLMQLGCDRAGWYSIDQFDHGGVPSVDRLVAGWESRKVGDLLAATPAKDSFYEVYQVEDEQFMVVGGETERMGGPFKMTWAFIVEPVGEDATRLISRARMEASPEWAAWLMGKVFYPPIHGLMSGVQLQNIKRLAERDAQKRGAQETAEVAQPVGGSNGRSL
jgi:hypothetical protein